MGLNNVKQNKQRGVSLLTELMVNWLGYSLFFFNEGY